MIYIDPSGHVDVPYVPPTLPPVLPPVIPGNSIFGFGMYDYMMSVNDITNLAERIGAPVKKIPFIITLANIVLPVANTVDFAATAALPVIATTPSPATPGELLLALGAKGGAIGLRIAAQSILASERGAIGVESKIGYHATATKDVESIMKNGFYPGTQAGRLGSHGTYVNNTPEGAIAEFKAARPTTEYTVLKVQYNPGINATTDIAPRFPVMEHPLNVDSISAPSIRMPGTINTNIFNGSVEPIEVIK